VNPVSALREIGFLLERSRADTYRVRAYRGAADVIERMSEVERAEHTRERTWNKVPGVGPKTATVISQAVAGEVPEFLQRLRDEKQPLVAGGLGMRAAVKGDLHTHSTWSDGGSPLEEMMASPLTWATSTAPSPTTRPGSPVARGLSAERLREQIEVVEDLNSAMAPFRCLQGIEVDILEDGGTGPDRRAARADGRGGGQRALQAALGLRDHDPPDGPGDRPQADQHPGHCTGRLIEGERGTRPPSTFDAEVVFEACRTFDVAVEINSRPERRDPPDRCCSWPSRWAASSPSTPTPMPRAARVPDLWVRAGREPRPGPGAGGQHLAGGPAAGVDRDEEVGVLVTN
jgi:putative hydrolase